MKLSHDEGIASHIGPESCAFVRKNKGEALTEERAGRVWSRENPKSRVPTLSYEWKATRCESIAQEMHRPCAVRDPEHVRRHFTREPGDPMAASGECWRPHREV